MLLPLLSEGKVTITYLCEGVNSTYAEVNSIGAWGSGIYFFISSFELFMNYELEVLRGEDVKYKYGFTRRNKTVDEHMSIFDLTEEDYAHEKSIANAEIANIGYRRWKND